MSELRITTVVTAIPIATIALGRLLYQAGGAAVEAGQQITEAAREQEDLRLDDLRAAQAQQPLLSPSEFAPVVHEASDAASALRELAYRTDLGVLQSDAERLHVQVQNLVSSNDKVGVLALASQLVSAKQERMQSTVAALTTESLQELGFQAEPLRTAGSMLVAKAISGHLSISIEVDRTKHGDVSLTFDAEGFHGGTCTDTLNALTEKLAGKGVHLAMHSRQRKATSGAADARRLPQGQRIRLRQ